jgi:hypothetical protein
MCARMKTWITLSLALHLAVLAWAAPVRRPTVAADAHFPRWDAVMFEIPAVAGTSSAAAREIPPPRVPQPTLEKDPGAAADRDGDAPPPAAPEAETRDASAGTPEENVASSAAIETGESGGVPAAGVPARVVRNEEFARMAYIGEMTAKTASYYRSAPKGFEGILRSSLAPGALREGGSATVSIGLSSSGELGDVEIRSESPALLSALRRVPWETAPLPTLYRIPCSKVELNVSVTGKRLAVGVRIL